MQCSAQHQAVRHHTISSDGAARHAGCSGPTRPCVTARRRRQGSVGQVRECTGPAMPQHTYAQRAHNTHSPARLPLPVGRHPGLLPFGNSAFGTSHHTTPHHTTPHHTTPLVFFFALCIPASPGVLGSTPLVEFSQAPGSSKHWSTSKCCGVKRQFLFADVSEWCKEIAQGPRAPPNHQPESMKALAT